MTQVKNNQKPTTCLSDHKVFSPRIDLNVIDEDLNNKLMRESIVAEAELTDTCKTITNLIKGETNQLKHYEKISEIYLFEYDTHYADISKLNAAQGVIIEMYSDILVHEKGKGESSKSKDQKERLAIIRLGIDSLMKYMVKYDQAKLIVRDSVIDRANLMKKNKDLADQLSALKKAFDAADKDEINLF